jgi:lysyl-tRNA synthetase class 2
VASIQSIKKNRLKKLENIRQAGINPYPAKVNRTHTCSEAKEQFEGLVKEDKELFLVGRLRTIRAHGGSSFAHIEDGTGRIQIYLKKDELGEKEYKFFQDNFDIGDFIEVKGKLFLTKKGEKTLLVKKYRIVAKSLAPLPEKWHGLKNEEERFRKRYLDILFNPEVREMIEKKAVFWKAVRQFLVNKGFLEVETPVLEATTGGADARPFITHHHALDIDLYLRISMGELWQKRLMIAGFEKTFEIGRQFRNEGMDAEHLQDYTQMEFYWAYADYQAGMKLVEDLYRYVAQETFGTLRFKIKDFEIDLAKPWQRYDYVETVKKMTGVDVLKANLKEIEAKLKELKIEYDREGFNLARAIDNLWKYCRKKIAGPGFLVNEPLLISPLAKKKEDNDNLVERFHVIIAGSELGNGYSELNDPIDQAKRFEEQEKMRQAGDQEAQMYDKDFVEALEYGMPPTCGFGLSERVFSFFINKPMRECQIFPLMKPRTSQ